MNALYKSLFLRFMIGICLGCMWIVCGGFKAMGAEKSDAYLEEYNYQGGILSEVTGPVQSVKFKGSPMRNLLNTKFLKNGKIKNRLMSYDKEGRPIGFGMNNGDTYVYMEIFYSPEGKLESIVTRSKLKSKVEEDIQTKTYKYEGDMLIQTIDEMTSSEGEENPVGKIYTYSDYKYDEAGNWISRKTMVRNLSSPDGTSEEYTESRTIKYY
ncbi:MAG: hypothetical protein K2M56_01460 [Muribaculaceae bacterium]|nr:hypothetical protein [Muribaculaceae bacterium]